jgi:23S rRNA (uridine2479-2'-O)-methyltransferase
MGMGAYYWRVERRGALKLRARPAARPAGTIKQRGAGAEGTAVPAVRSGGIARVERVLTADNRFQRLEVLKQNRTKRHRYQEFVVEGVRAINQAREHGWQFSTLAYAAGRPLSAWAQALLAAGAAARVLELEPGLMERLSERDEPSEVVAVARMAPNDPSRLRFWPGGLMMVFDRPASPGNLGSIIRSCDALGAGGLILTGHGADPYDPQAVRASMGSLFALPVVQMASPQEIAKWVETLAASPEATARPQIVGASGEAAVNVEHVDFLKPTVLIAGNETHGLSHGYRELCDLLARIPMSGAADSLNVASAASILLYEAGRQRRAAARD